LPDADVWKLSAPPVSWAPFSVESRAALTQVSVFAACVSMGLILRVALSKSSKRLLLQVLACSSGCVALYWVFQVSLKTPYYLARTAGADLGASGIFFGFWLLMGMGLFVEALARAQRGIVPLFVLGVVGNLIGMLFFATALSVAAYSCLAVLLFIYWLIYLAPHVSKSVQLRLFVVSLLAAGAVSVALMCLFPHNPVADKLKAALPLSDYWNALSAMKNIRTETAVQIWQEHPWVGVGADGFYHYVGLSVSAKDWGLIKAGQSYVCNDGLQFLCEYGVLGAGLLLAVVITLMVPVCYRARIEWKYKVPGDNEGRAFLLRLSPIVVASVLATGVCALESLVASPFRSAALLLAWTCVMAAMPAFLPLQSRDVAQR